jgi:hypothetical protein
MAGIEPAGEKIARHLQEAVKQLHDDIARVELWAGALGCFARPIPDYDPTTSRFALPSPVSGQPKSQARKGSTNGKRKPQNGSPAGGLQG